MYLEEFVFKGSYKYQAVLYLDIFKTASKVLEKT